MEFSRARLEARERGSRGCPTGASDSDARLGAKHTRIRRGFVPVNKGIYTVRFWPLKDCVHRVGVSNQTLRAWIKNNVITVYKMYRMYVMSKAEQEALGAVVRRYHVGTKRHKEISDEFIQEARKALLDVRIALDSLGNPEVPMSEKMWELVQPSIQDIGD